MTPDHVNRSQAGNVAMLGFGGVACEFSFQIPSLPKGTF